MKKPLLQVFAYSIVTLSVILCQKDSDEGRPYEFGFTIDGQQHRHEKKDENGIIQGEFGFITADGVYHVTVYATDENGNFKILSMRNIRISAPLDGSPATGPISPEAGKYLKKSNKQADPPSSSPAAPADHPVPNLATTPKPKAPYVFTTQPTIKPACGGCGYVTTSKPISGQTLPSKSIPQGPSTSQLHSNIVPSQTPSNLAPSAGTQTHLGVQNYQSPQQNQFGQQQEIQRPLQDQNLPAQGFVVPPTHIDSQQNVRRPVQDQNLLAQGFVAPPTDIHSQQNVQRPLQDQNLPAQGFAVPLQSQYQNSNDQAGNVELLPFQEQKLQAPHSYPDQGPPSSQSGVQGFSDEEIITNIPGIGSITNRGHLAQTNYPATAGQNADLSTPEAHQKLPPITISNNAIHVGGKNPMDIPIKDKFPGMVDGLPEGVEEADVKNILYKFKYTVGFHGHYEKGLKNGTKIGGYFVNGRDGISRVVTYVADENGYRPKFKFINLGLDSPDTPKEDTEKTFGLKSFEFVWYPIE